jgi:hypothetical protein
MPEILSWKLNISTLCDRVLSDKFHKPVLMRGKQLQGDRTLGRTCQKLQAVQGFRDGDSVVGSMFLTLAATDTSGQAVAVS